MQLKMNITDVDGANKYNDLNNVCCSVIIKNNNITIGHMKDGC